MAAWVPPLFDEQRTAQAAGHLIERAGGSLSVLKLMKLLYLAERLSLQLHAVPMIGDVPVSMQHGPVLSRTLNLIDGTAAGADGSWDALVAERDGHNVALRDPSSLDRGALSRADIRVLDRTFDEFGGMDPWALVRYCHEHLREWEDPGYSSHPIPLRRIFMALGYSDTDAEAAALAIEQQARESEAMRAGVAQPW